MYWIVILGLTLICCVTAERFQTQTEYSVGQQDSKEFVISLESHYRYRRRSDPREWQTTSSSNETTKTQEITESPKTTTSPPTTQTLSTPLAKPSTKSTTTSNLSTVPTVLATTSKPSTTTTVPTATSKPSTTTSAVPETTNKPLTTSTVPPTTNKPSTASAVSTTTKSPTTTKSSTTVTKITTIPAASSITPKPLTTSTPTTTTKLPTTSAVPTTAKPLTTSTTKAPPMTSTESKAITTSKSSNPTTHTSPVQSSPPTTLPATYIKQFDNHKYYKKTVLHDSTGSYWDELYNHTEQSKLSDNGHLDSVSIALPFTMPYYGHNITKVQVTTGGFLYMSPWVHKFLTFSQYVAPLMANFDTKSPDSEILYKSYQDSFVLEWRNVNLNDQGHHGQFTFQTKLFQNGTIIFVYKKVPVNVSAILFDKHPVKLGISDAYYSDYIRSGVRYRRIFRYHSIDIDKYLITENTVVIFQHQPTCNLATTCDVCVTPGQEFECSWCPNVWRCSDGFDWYRQEWLGTDCDTNSGNTTEICKVTTTTTTTTTTTPKPTTTTTTSTTSKPTTTTTTSTTPKPTTTSTTQKSTTMTPKPTTTTQSSPVASTTTNNPPTPSTPMPSTATTTATTSTTKATTTKIKSTTPMLTTTTTTTTPATTSTTSTPIITTSTRTTTTTPQTSSTTTKPTTSKPTRTTQGPPVVQAQSQKPKETTNSAAIAVPIVLILLVIVVLAGGWIYYAYTHPETSSGQWLIEHRPSKLRERISNLFKWDMQTGEKYLVKNDDIDMTIEESTA